jgi:hypothetical protein
LQNTLFGKKKIIRNLKKHSLILGKNLIRDLLMYIYNVTINIQEVIHEKWLEWMKNEHIPDMMATGKFTKALMSRVMVEEEMGGLTYSVQYTTKNKEMLLRYYEEDAARLRTKTKPFEGLFVAFRTELEIVSEQ